MLCRSILFTVVPSLVRELRIPRGWEEGGQRLLGNLGNAFSGGRFQGWFLPGTVDLAADLPAGRQAACEPPAPTEQPFDPRSVGTSQRRFYSWWMVVGIWDGPQKKKVWASCFHCDSGMWESTSVEYSQ